MIIPDPLPYHRLYDLRDVKELNNVYCYVLEAYPDEGVAVTVVRDSGDVGIRLSDFSGNIIDVNSMGDLSDYINEIMSDYMRSALAILSAINIDKFILYFSCSSDILLVDIRWDMNKYCGPGWLQDFMGKRIPVQKQIGKPLVLDEDNRKMLCDGIGDYSGDVVLKPSKFKLMNREDVLVPMYGVIRREIKSVT